MINYIKVEKTDRYGEPNIIISFNKDEWLTLKAVIERAYIEKDDLFSGTNEDRRFNSRTMEHIFDVVCEVGDLIGYD